jgi:hypothetical protein
MVLLKHVANKQNNLFWLTKAELKVALEVSRGNKTYKAKAEGVECDVDYKYGYSTFCDIG